MYKTDTSREPKPRPPRADCCPESECTSGLRNNYYVGKRLTPDAFRVEQRYLNGRRHLLNRTLFGAGVVSGYAVAYAQEELRSQPPGCLLVSTGLAFDAAGRELLNTETLVLRMEDVIVLDRDGRPVAKCKGKAPDWPARQPWLLKVHYAERPVGRTTVQDECSCERHPWDRVCETVRFTIQLTDRATCCREPECGLDCRCPEDSCCGERLREKYAPDPGKYAPDPGKYAPDPGKVKGEIQAGMLEEVRPQATPVERVPAGPIEAVRQPPVRRGGCECLCHEISRPLRENDCPCLTEIEEACGNVCVDLHDGVPLACVVVDRDACGCWAFTCDVEMCGPRPLVLNNRVLFDLIRGCDLTRIRVGWERLYGRDLPVPWEEFQQSFGKYEPGKGWSGGLYEVAFTRPVFAATLRPECFAMTFIVRREDTHWGRVIRVPLIGLDRVLEPGDPAMARGARLRFDPVWFGDEISGQASVCNDEIALVELEVRGERIIDCNGLAVDVDANGTPGGISIIAFRVGPPPASVEDERQPDRWMAYQQAPTDPSPKGA